MISPGKFRDVLRFGKLLIATRDNDPVYPVMKEVARLARLNEDQVQWLVYLYLCFYNVSSAWATFQEFPDPADVTKDPDRLLVWETKHRARLHCNIERRGLRGGRVTTAIQEFAFLVPSSGRQSIADWLWVPGAGPDGDSQKAFLEFWDRVQQVRFVGRWAAFKWLDLLKHVAGWPIEFPDMRMGFCSGPRYAIEGLYCDEPSGRQDAVYIRRLEEFGATLRHQLRAAGLDLSFDELETVCCNYHSLAEGRYYVGHDWDEMVHDLFRGVGDATLWILARSNVAPDPSILGEENGWRDIRKSLNLLYKKRGEIHCDWKAIV